MKNHETYSEFVWHMIDLIPSAPETLILFALSYVMTDTGAKISRKYLSIKTGLSVRTVTNVIKSLREQGILDVKRSMRDDGSTSINTYSFSRYPPSRKCTEGVQEMPDKYNNILNINKTNIIYKSKSKYNPYFLEVYNFYPREPVGRTNKSKSALKFGLIKDLDNNLILEAVKNRLTAYSLEQNNPNDYQFLEGLQVLLAKDLTQFLTKTQHPDGEFVLPVATRNSNMFIKNTNLVNTSSLLANPNIRSIAEISKGNNDKQLK
mgnify:CR=1 FL=1